MSGNTRQQTTAFESSCNPPTILAGRQARLLGGILLAFTAVMLALIGNDYAWTIWLNQHRIEWVGDFLGRTVFEGEGFGGSDAAIIFLAVAVGLYIHSWAKSNPIRRLYAWRPNLGFIVTSGLVCSLYMVHSLKWVMGRARPRMVLKKGLAFSEWFEFGPHYVTEGIYRGSFPSGHTAAVLSLLTLAYILAADVHRTAGQRTAGWLWGCSALAYCLFMATGRAMALGHWLSDCFFSILMGWALMHVLYYRVLQVPRQMQYFYRHLMHAQTPRFWELTLCLYIFLGVLGAMAVVIGLRAFWEQPVPWLCGLIIPGGALMVIFGRKAVRFHRQVFGAFRQ